MPRSGSPSGSHVPSLEPRMRKNFAQGIEQRLLLLVSHTYNTPMTLSQSREGACL